MYQCLRFLYQTGHRFLCLIMLHFDTYEEARLAGKSFGSTKSGIAPFYSDKYAKIGFQVI